MTTSTYAPELLVQTWFNTDRPLLLSALRGRVVVLAAFQVLCPNSIGAGIPQAQRIHETSYRNDLAVLGLHAPFEPPGAINTGVREACILDRPMVFAIGLVGFG